jgi:Fe-S-cluster-containing hydrogenase component 2
MKEGVIYTGVPSAAELAACPGIPSEERLRQGRVAVIECVQEIPCNPCEAACKFGAIKIGPRITARPVLDEGRCTGCGLCVPGCPGLAITIVDKSRDDGLAVVDFPFEYLPLPEKGQTVAAANRLGEEVCPGEVLSVKKAKSFDGTTVLGLLIPVEYADEVRTMKRRPRKVD